jgi:hypothetical protein
MSTGLLESVTTKKIWISLNIQSQVRPGANKLTSVRVKKVSSIDFAELALLLE